MDLFIYFIFAWSYFSSTSWRPYLLVREYHQLPNLVQVSKISKMLQLLAYIEKINLVYLFLFLIDRSEGLDTKNLPVIFTDFLDFLGLY